MWDVVRDRGLGFGVVSGNGVGGQGDDPRPCQVSSVLELANRQLAHVLAALRLVTGRGRWVARWVVGPTSVSLETERHPPSPLKENRARPRTHVRQQRDVSYQMVVVPNLLL